MFLKTHALHDLCLKECGITVDMDVEMDSFGNVSKSWSTRHALDSRDA